MEALVDDGLAKNIGIRYNPYISPFRISTNKLCSNTQGSLILDILRYAKYEPQVHQIEHHPYLTQEPLVKLCKELGIAITAYSSLGPQSYLELGVNKGVVGLLEHDATTAIAKSHSRSKFISMSYVCICMLF